MAGMAKAILLSVVVVPVLLGLRAASDRRPRRGLVRLLTLVLLFDVLYAAALYYLYLKIL